MRLHHIGSNQTEVEFSNGTRILFSYDTPVAARVAVGDKFIAYRTEVFYSATTLRHIASWFGSAVVVGKIETKPVEFFDNLAQGKENKE